MIPKLYKAGKSFKGLAAYLAHDPKANTHDRVGWTHTLNTAHDDVASAVNEMLWTARNAEMLKREAGIRANGRSAASPVKHFSLNWHPSEQPSREQMIEAVRKYLDYMGWGDHQAVVFEHHDKSHPHVHVMLNAVNPSNGRTLDTSFEKRRSQDWALEYERENGKIFCEERLRDKAEREVSPTRETWQKFKEAEQEVAKSETGRERQGAWDYFDRADRPPWQTKEWDLLRQYQREKRTAFFVEGKQAFTDLRKAIYREVRTEFRGRWKDFYSAKRAGLKGQRLAKMKTAILADQNAELDVRRTAACGDLRTTRDTDYSSILRTQKDERAYLKTRQAEGLRTYHLLDQVYEPGATANQQAPGREQQAGSNDLRDAFRGAGRETCEPVSDKSQVHERDEAESFAQPVSDKHRVRDPANAIGDLGMGAVGAIANIAEKLFDGFLGGGEQPQARPAPAPDHTKRVERIDQGARTAEGQSRSAEAEAAEAARLHAFWEERSRRRGRDRGD